jgi:hypothetical protein
VAIALLLSASAAGAAPATSGREAERTAAYQEGLKRAEAGEWSEAVERFRRVVAIRSAPRARFTLGEAEEKSGMLASAKASYLLALAEARAAGDQEAAGAAGAALAAIERRVPKLLVRLMPDAPDARMVVDSREVAAGLRSVELDPGEHRVQVRAAGHREFEQRIMASEGRTAELIVRLEPDALEAPAGSTQRATSAATSTPDAPEESDGGAGWGPPVGAWVLGAAGLAATGVGIALYVTGQSDYDEAAAFCTSAQCTDAGHTDDGNAARARIIIGDVILGAGAAAFAGALLWWAVTAGDDGPTDDEPAVARARLDVGLCPGGLGVTFQGAL